MEQRWMFSEESYRKLVHNHRHQHKGTAAEVDYIPVCKLFNPTGTGTWLVTELDPENELAFGLCDLGYPEMGYISMSELEEFRGLGGLGIEEDAHFRTSKRLSEWATEARQLGYIKA